MASLRKFPRSPYYFACFTLPGGRRVQRSTKETARKAAQKKADDWESLSKGRAKARQAHRVIADIYRDAHGKELPDATTRAFLTGWLVRREGEVAPRTHEAYEARIRHFLEWLETTADEPLAELETHHFLAYRDELAGRVSPSTVNQAIRILRVAFENARKDGYIADNLAKDCGRLKRDGGRTRHPLGFDDIKAVLEVANGEWCSMIYFGLYTGLRLKDIARLTWANVDTDASEIRVDTAKSGRLVRIPICNPLLRHIESLPAGDNPRAPLHPRAFNSLNGSTLSRQFGELLADIGLREKRTHGAQKEGRSVRRKTTGISFHSLRHSATSMMKNAGISDAVVMDIIGHESVAVSAQYTHIESAAKLKALNSIPDLVR